MAAFRPATIVTGGVNGVPSLAWASAIRRQSNANRGAVPSAASPHALSETDANARPGGHISAFCEPETTTSMPHSSVRSSTPPRLETASTTSAAPLGRTASAIARMSWTTPVDVSDWVTKATRQPAAASPTRAGSRRSPHGCSTSTISALYAVTSFCHRSPKLPAEATSTRSPGDTMLATADSIA